MMLNNLQMCFNIPVHRWDTKFVMLLSVQVCLVKAIFELLMTGYLEVDSSPAISTYAEILL